MRSFLEFHLLLIVATLFLWNGIFIILIFIIFHQLSTTVCDNGTALYSFFLVMKLNITIVTCCDLVIVILLL